MVRSSPRSSSSFTQEFRVGTMPAHDADSTCGKRTDRAPGQPRRYWAARASSYRARPTLTDALTRLSTVRPSGESSADCRLRAKRPAPASSTRLSATCAPRRHPRAALREVVERDWSRNDTRTSARRGAPRRQRTEHQSRSPATGRTPLRAPGRRDRAAGSRSPCRRAAGTCVSISSVSDRHADPCRAPRHRQKNALDQHQLDDARRALRRAPAGHRSPRGELAALARRRLARLAQPIRSVRPTTPSSTFDEGFHVRRGGPERAALERLEPQDFALLSWLARMELRVQRGHRFFRRCTGHVGTKAADDGEPDQAASRQCIGARKKSRTDLTGNRDRNVQRRVRSDLTPRKPFWRTPTIVTGRPFARNVRPTTAGSPPKRVRQ